MPGHAVAFLDQPFHRLGRRASSIEHTVIFRDQKRHGTVGGAFGGLFEVAFEEVLDLLLPAPAVGRTGHCQSGSRQSKTASQSAKNS